jgi:hypothetical protein
MSDVEIELLEEILTTLKEIRDGNAINVTINAPASPLRAGGGSGHISYSCREEYIDSRTGGRG